MSVIVDTSVWSLALRRNTPDNAADVITSFRDLITNGRVVLLGVIRQEILSGIRHVEQFEKLRDYLRPFPNLELSITDYELAAEFFNTCRSNGVQGSNTDFLICAAAVNRGYNILTKDKDFENFKIHVPIVLL
ncbi:PIN domain-containing protein [Calothrix sp. PCC 6303]|uniref:type II toxin-antitoxin system VapC family toxin n=1 Tax=Calothrix sp. PCC 6303 TaxID=1170562 RepID=UPI0002A05198|nr:PIN domain-containing protein [Calothrix sp. PCC 6303]AFZ00314.1 PilT protein domain protein [Calothrix sp. PCC 6303]